MNPKDHAKTEIERLRARILRANEAYYLHDNPIMDDASYDDLRTTFKRLDAEFPGLAESLPVGAPPLAARGKIRHARPMLSLDNAFSDADIAAFIARLRKRTRIEDTPALCASPKIDGLAVSLRYDAGRLTQGATRGNGTLGENITTSLGRIDDIPTALSGTGWPDVLHIRGEIHMHLSEFAAYNAQAESKGERTFVNPRNAASGEVRRIHAGSAPLPLHFAAYDWIEDIAKTASDGINRLGDWGIPVVGNWTAINHPQALTSYYRKLEARRAELDHDIDGVVIAVDDLTLRTRLGATTHHPRWAIAWKFPAHTARTQIENISLQVGRTGSLTPVAHLTPVTIGGVTISRANLHNEEEITRKDIRIGDWAQIRRAGDVIPQIVRIEPDRRGADSIPYAFPSTCPVCGSPAIRDKEKSGDAQACRRCTAGHDCPAQRLALLEHFVSRAGIDIDGLGPKQLALLDERGLVRTPADIFRLGESIAASRYGPLRDWNGFGQKSEDALMAAIETRRTMALPRFLAALGIRHLGQSAAATIAAHFRSITALMDALDGDDGENALAAIDGIGPQTAQSLIRFVTSKPTRDLLDDLLDCMKIEDTPQTAVSSSPMAGKTVVFTGTLAGQSRAEAQAQAKALGARVTASISKTTDYLIAGQAAGSKRKKAQTLGVTILDEAGWNDLVGTSHES